MEHWNMSGYVIQSLQLRNFSEKYQCTFKIAKVAKLMAQFGLVKRSNLMKMYNKKLQKSTVEPPRITCACGSSCEPFGLNFARDTLHYWSWAILSLTVSATAQRANFQSSGVTSGMQFICVGRKRFQSAQTIAGLWDVG